MLDQERIRAQHLIPGAGRRDDIANCERTCDREFNAVVLSEK
jgi:hypothetical protein